MKRPLKPLPHGIIDYVWVAKTIAAPWLLGFSRNKKATAHCLAAGAGIAAMSLLTRYPRGAAKLIPFPMHGIIEALAGAETALAPWTMGFADNAKAKWFHVISGLGVLGVVAMTDYQAAEAGESRRNARSTHAEQPEADISERASDQMIRLNRVMQRTA